MMKELESNKVSKSRRNEIVRAYKKVLNDDQYYCISPMNFIKERLMKTYKSKRVVVDNFKFGYRGSTIYLCEGTVEFNGHTINVVKQSIDPKTSYEFYHYDDYTALYFSKKDIDIVCEKMEA
jgi:FAD synthase